MPKKRGIEFKKPISAIEKETPILYYYYLPAIAAAGRFPEHGANGQTGAHENQRLF
jgi:hypothetical protein